MEIISTPGYIFFECSLSPTANIYRNDGDGNLNLRLRSYVRQFYTIDPLVQLKLAGMYCEPVEIFIHHLSYLWMCVSEHLGCFKSTSQGGVR